MIVMAVPVKVVPADVLCPVDYALVMEPARDPQEVVVWSKPFSSTLNPKRECMRAENQKMVQLARVGASAWLKRKEAFPYILLAVVQNVGFLEILDLCSGRRKANLYFPDG